MDCCILREASFPRSSSSLVHVSFWEVSKDLLLSLAPLLTFRLGGTFPVPHPLLQVLQDEAFLVAQVLLQAAAQRPQGVAALELEKRRLGMNNYIGRPKGKKDARSHLYSDSDEIGFPVRLCDWLGIDDEVERVEGPVTCRHCLKIQGGGRKVAFG